MIDEQQKSGAGNGTGSPTIGQAVEAGLVRLKTVWRRHEWTPNLLAEYRRILAMADSPQAVERAIDKAIETTAINYPPPPGAFASALAVNRERAETHRGTSSRSIDEDALIDALAYLSAVRGTDDEDYAEGLITSIRKRLPDRGAMAEARDGVKFVRAEPYRYDPPGAVRFAVRQPA